VVEIFDVHHVTTRSRYCSFLQPIRGDTW